MTRWERRRGSRSASRRPREQKKWVAKEQPQSRLPSTDDSPASGVGEAAVAADGAPEETAVAAGGVLEEAAVAARGEGAVRTFQDARNDACECVLSGSDVETTIQNRDENVAAYPQRHHCQ